MVFANCCVVTSITRYAQLQVVVVVNVGILIIPDGGSLFAGYKNPASLKRPRAQILCCCRSNKLQKVRKFIK